MKPTKIAVLVSSMFVLSLIIVRSYYSMVTGYLLPDEAFYYNLFIVEGMGFSVYRPFLHLMYLMFFYGSDGLFSLMVRGALFCIVWALGCVFVLYRILVTLELPELPSAMVLLSLPLFPVFTLMSLFFVTETLGLFLVLLGILFSISYVRKRSVKYAALSSMFFVLASYVREPYLLFVFGSLVLMLSLRSPFKPLVVYSIIAFLVVPVPTSLYPVSIAQPVSNFLLVGLPETVMSIPAGSVSEPPVQPQPSIPEYVFRAANSIQFSFSPEVVRAFFIGLFYGFGPFFMLLVFVSLPFLLRLRSKTGLFLLMFSVFGLITYFITVDFAVLFLPNSISQWTSNIIRLSSSALPASIGLSYLYSRIKPRYFMTGLVVYIMIGLLLMPSFVMAIQSSQNLSGLQVDRLSFDYRTPYLRMSQVAEHSGRTLIITQVGKNQLQAYVSSLKDVVVVSAPANKREFDQLLSLPWDSIFLYDSWVTTLNPSFLTTCQCYPEYYRDIVLSDSYGQFSMNKLWVDGESYAFRLEKVGA